MIPPIARHLGSRVLTAILGVTAVLVIVWYWRLDPAGREAIWTLVRGTLIWIGFVAVLPWALFFLPGRVVRAESNLAGVLLLAGYLAADVGFALYLTGGRFGDPWQRALLVLGFLCAAVYNFRVCDYLAERAEDSA